MGEIATFRRTYGNIPRQQITYDRQWVKKPELTGEFPQVSGDALIVQPEEGVPRWIFYTQKAVTSDSGAPNANSPTGGTYTITVGSSTTGALFWNSSAAAVQSALNALPSVSGRGSITVVGSYVTGFTMTGTIAGAFDCCGSGWFSVIVWQLERMSPDAMNGVAVFKNMSGECH